MIQEAIHFLAVVNETVPSFDNLGLIGLAITQIALVIVAWINTRQNRVAKTSAEAAKEQLQNGQTDNFRQKFDATASVVHRLENGVDELLAAASETRGALKSIDTRVTRLEGKKFRIW